MDLRLERPARLVRRAWPALVQRDRPGNRQAVLSRKDLFRGIRQVPLRPAVRLVHRRPARPTWGPRRSRAPTHQAERRRRPACPVRIGPDSAKPGFRRFASARSASPESLRPFAWRSLELRLDESPAASGCCLGCAPVLWERCRICLRLLLRARPLSRSPFRFLLVGRDSERSARGSNRCEGPCCRSRRRHSGTHGP